ncbi:MAG: response regulator [Defluviitaleaceae bacterium]|nr:response regulator [Defluviitaleaceae bacterium]
MTSIGVTRKIRLAIVDDDVELTKMMEQQFKTINAIDMVGSAYSAESGLLLVKPDEIDVVLIDLVMPGRDGFYMLEHLNRMRPNRPICIILSALNSPHTISRAAELGADHFVLKPFDMDLLIKRIVEIGRFKAAGSFEGLSPNRQIEDFIQSILDGLPISHALMGYRYIRSAIRLSIEDSSMLDGITKRLYPEIAKRHSSTPSRVERAIRHAIQTIWQREGGSKRFADLMGFPIEDEKPTNSHFIASIVGRYRYFHPEDEMA